MLPIKWFSGAAEPKQSHYGPPPFPAWDIFEQAAPQQTAHGSALLSQNGLDRKGP